MAPTTDRHTRMKWIFAVVIVIALAVSSFALYRTFTAQSSAQSLALQVQEVCNKTPTVARKQGLNCHEANEVSEGPSFIPGPRGKQGPEGPQGPQGPKGDRGPRGYAGTGGEDGSDGSQGPVGATGEQGEQGERGPAGAQGPRGEQGPQGERGPKGPQGPKGDKGDKGDPGPPPSEFTFTDGVSEYRCTPVSDGSTQYECVREG